MLKVLEYSVEFPTTGRQFSNAVEFAPGLTTVTGRNEAGKTIILEMIGYCLFGKSALRGKATDYRNLSAKLSLNLGESQIEIVRERKESLTVDGVVKAVGADALNKAIPALLGFGLDVFNVACAAQQGDISRLTQMRPTERRAMVERLIGLNQLETVEKDCRTEARSKNQLAEGLVLSMPQPIEPIRPEGYRLVAEVEAEVVTLRESEQLRRSLLTVEEPGRPIPPQAPDQIDVEALEAHENQRVVQIRERAHIEGQLAGIPTLTATVEDLEAAVLYRDYQAEVARRGPRPEYALNDLNHFQAIINARLKLGEQAQCPNCQHEFHLGVTAEEEALVDQECPLVLSEITTEFRRHQLWAEPLTTVPAKMIDDLPGQIRAFEHRHLRAQLLEQLEQPVLGSRAEDLQLARKYQIDMSWYASAEERYDREAKTYHDARKQLATLVDNTERLHQLSDQLAMSRHYDQLLSTYQTLKERFDDLTAQAVALRVEAEGFSNGAAAIQATRVAVKAELAPALSRAASSLISQMTDGERNRVLVDEDFEVTVDGQPLQTLSGSGKSVVNLALRLGMGQVLTARVLPIFLGDEIDADMDRERAGSTHSTMQTLKDYLQQIILITHKPNIESDQEITLGT